MGAVERKEDERIFFEGLLELNKELERLNAEAWVLVEQIGENISKLLTVQ